MEISIKPKRLSGVAQVPSSKNLSHYYILAAALSKQKVVLENMSFPQDVLATLSAVQKLGAKVQICFADRKVEITGAGERLGRALQNKENLFGQTVIHCQDSGNTLRLCMPLFLLWGGAKFYGTDTLLERNRERYAELWKGHQIDWCWQESGISCLGFLQNGHYQISNQMNVAFIIGMLFALAMAPGQSTLEVAGGVAEQEYLQIALEILGQFGVKVQCENDTSFTFFTVEGGQQYGLAGKGQTEHHIVLEGDYGQAAIYLAANALGSEIEVKGLPALEDTLQPEKVIIDLLEQCKADGPWEVDISRIPYLAPVLVGLASLRIGTAYLFCGKQQPETYQRLLAMSYQLNKMGADICVKENGVQINGVPMLHGAEVDSGGDHRIAMTLAVMATVCKEPVMLKGAECVVKSYPDFWQQYGKLGGEIECIEE